CDGRWTRAARGRMRTENWKRARDLFAKVVELPIGEREPFLAAASGGDDALIAEVREMLAAFDGDSFLEHPLAHAAAALAVDSEPPTQDDPTVAVGATQPGRVGTGDPGHVARATVLPTTIGPYQVLGVLGEGGMGVVYRAHHHETGRLVALKTVRVPSESLL